MGLRRWLASVLMIAGAVARLPAQGGVPTLAPPAVAQVNGFPVTGSVVCADTQHPARFAQVMLVPAATGVSDFDRGRMATGRTDFDGRFTIPNVLPGEYFATAELAGYINNAPAVRIALSAGGDALNALSSVPRVQVTAGGAVAQFSLERGSVLAGSVQWDDGSPAAGVGVSAQPAPAATSGAGSSTAPNLSNGYARPGGLPFGGGAQTDDRGHFRLSGLAPGSYLLRASVQSPMPQLPGSGRYVPTTTLNVYAPGKLRRTDAGVFTLAAGEERADLTVVLDLGGMHTVSGVVSSTAAAVRSGSVTLTDQTDASLNRRGLIGPDGSFLVPYVPPGTYTLRVNAGSQPASNGRGRDADSGPGVRFQPTQESLTVTDSDLSGIAVSVTAAASSGSQ